MTPAGSNHQPAIHEYDDEIDLKQLLLNLWHHKWIIIGSTIISVVIAVIFAYGQTQYYRSEATINPAPDSTYILLNSTEIMTLDKESALNHIQQRLNRRSTKIAYFELNPDLFQYYHTLDKNRASSRFLEDDIVVEAVTPESKTISALKLTYIYPDGVDGDEVLNGYYNFAEKIERESIKSEYENTRNQRIDNLNRKLETLTVQLKEQTEVEIAKLDEEDRIESKTIEDKIAAIKDELKTVRLNRIKELEEAYAIAKEIGLKTPKTLSYFSNKDLAAQSGAIINEIYSNDNDQPLYLLGTHFIKAELDVLKTRKNDDFTDKRIADLNRQLKELSTNRNIQALENRIKSTAFVPNTDIIKTEIFRLKNLPDNAASIKLTQLADSAYTAPTAVKPRRAVIIGTSLIAGFIFGIFIALIRSTFDE